MSERSEASGTRRSLGVEVSFQKEHGGSQQPGLRPRHLSDGGAGCLMVGTRKSTVRRTEGLVFPSWDHSLECLFC